MYGEYLNRLISFIVASIDVLFIASPLTFDMHHDDTNFFVVRYILVPEVIKEIAVAK